MAAARRQSAFTMVEIALCLAIVGFALVAIIGVLPAGLNVQRDNREETIINEEGAIWMDALRAGGTTQFGVFDQLTNYVDRIGVESFYYESATDLVPDPVPKRSYYADGPFRTGFEIVGLLSTPQIIPIAGSPQGAYFSNYVYAYVRSLNGIAAEKPPQDNPDVKDLAFSYKLLVQTTPVDSFDPGAQRTNWMAQVEGRNLADVRLLFRWPLKRGIVPGQPNPELGAGRLPFRVQFSGNIREVDPRNSGFPTYLYFFQPRDYIRPAQYNP